MKKTEIALFRFVISWTTTGASGEDENDVLFYFEIIKFFFLILAEATEMTSNMFKIY